MHSTSAPLLSSDTARRPRTRVPQSACNDSGLYTSQHRPLRSRYRDSLPTSVPRTTLTLLLTLLLPLMSPSLALKRYATPTLNGFTAGSAVLGNNATLGLRAGLTWVYKTRTGTTTLTLTGRKKWAVFLQDRDENPWMLDFHDRTALRGRETVGKIVEATTAVITGRNVGRVRVVDGNGKEGELVMLERGGQWQWSVGGTSREMRETGRDEWTVYLQCDGGDEHAVMIGLKKRKVMHRTSEAVRYRDVLHIYDMDYSRVEYWESDTK